MRLRVCLWLNLLVISACGISARVDQQREDEQNGMNTGQSRCLIDDGAECNLVSQCGCEAGQHCQALGEAARPTCVKPGSLKPDSACNVTSQCPAGQTCDRGSCRSYCEDDADCEKGSCFPAQAVNGKDLRDVKVCWKACQAGAADGCGRGTACRSFKTPAGNDGTFCVAPFDPCPTVEDGTCDDQSGTKLCADGTDAKDCNCSPKLRDAKCDPIAQCGCAKGSTCEVRSLDKNTSDDNVITLTAICSKAGTHAQDEPCTDEADCAPGLFCHARLHLCSAYCDTDKGCGQAACIPLNNPDDPKLGACMTRCDRATKKPCPDSANCVDFTDMRSGFEKAPGNYCTEVVQQNCPTNGVCDEPQGTGWCAAGTDAADCCKMPTNGSVCDPVSQCGCENQPDTQCQHLGDSASTMCLPKGTQAPWSRCSKAQGQCPPGYHCADQVCRRYCTKQEDCGPANFCTTMPELDGLGACYVACDFDAAQNTCPDGTVCQRITANFTFCGVIYNDCPFVGDGKCDDTRPGGSRICAMGTDSDCM